MTEKTQIVITAKDETRAAIASAQRGLESLKASGAGLANTFASIGAGGGLIGLIGGAGLAATVKTAIDSLDKLDEAAERVGVTVEDLSALDFAGKLSGVEFDELTTGLTKLSVKMQEAAGGSKEAGAWFEALGVKVTDASGKLKSADAVFAEVATAFADMEDGAGKTALAVEGFGRSGAKLVPLLNQGADGLAKMRTEGEALGAVIDGKLAKQAAEFNDNLDRLKTVSAAAGISIANELLPSLNQLSQEFLDGITAAGGFWAALNAGATLNPFKSVGENLASVRADLAKMDADVKESGYLDEARYTRKQNQLKMLEAQDARLKKKMADGLGLGDIDGLVPKNAAPNTGGGGSKPKGGGARAQADDAERLLKNLREQIAVNEADLQSVEKLSAAEKERAKTLYQLDTGTLKATAIQREAILAAYGTLAANEKLLATQEDYRKALEGAESSNLKNRQGMLEQIAAAERAADLYGLTADQIATVNAARLEEAIALASVNGASAEHIAVMEEELALQQQLAGALEKSNLKRLLSGTKTEEGKRKAADVATLDRAKAAGEIDDTQYQEAIDKMKGAVEEMDQFTIQAARNMQSAFSDFLFDPFADGMDGMGYKFAQTLQRMAADALAANVMNTLFGNMGKDGKVGGWVGGLISAMGFHEGGIVGQPGSESFTRAVPASMFSRARRYHSGGLVGDEVPAILKKGELVLTKEQQRGMASSPAPAQNIRIVNAFDTSVIGDYLGSAAGERVIMNAVQRNASAMRQVLA